jgi:aspartate kinase
MRKKHRSESAVGAVAFEKDRGVTHLAIRERISHFTVHLPDPAADMARVFADMAETGVSVFLIKVHEDRVDFVVGLPEADAALQRLQQGQYAVQLERECAVVSTVARSMRDLSGIMSRIIESLNAAGVEVREFADSYNSVSCLVRASDLDSAVAALAGELGVQTQDPSPEDPW